MKYKSRQLRIQLSDKASNQLTTLIRETGLSATEVINQLLLKNAHDAMEKRNEQSQ